MKKLSVAAAFSLVELTLAVGIAAFCLIAVFGLIPVGVQTNRNATSQTAATNILSSVVSDIRASPPGQTTSAKYQINRAKPSNTTVCFDGQGQSCEFRYAERRAQRIIIAFDLMYKSQHLLCRGGVTRPMSG